MGVLHVAVNYQRHDLIDLILMAEATNVNLNSNLHGTPLHLACKIGNLKIVQQLLISGADFSIKSQKNGKLAKDCTDNQRIVFLIEKYEKLRALELTIGDDSNSSDELMSNDDRSTSTPKGPATNIMSLLKRSSS